MITEDGVGVDGMDALIRTSFAAVIVVGEARH